MAEKKKIRSTSSQISIIHFWDSGVIVLGMFYKRENLLIWPLDGTS